MNLQPIMDFLSLPIDLMVMKLFYVFGWIPFAVVTLWGLKEIWINNIVQPDFYSKQKYILLAIDIPRGNKQSPRAVEDMFNYLAGAHGSINLIERFWEGKFQVAFSLEIVSIEGYTQFLIHTPEQFRYLVESAVYAQYPDSEITEVNDYTIGTPSSFPDNDYELFGSEFILAADQALPIKTYIEFEHDLGDPETKFRDPMTALMDLCSSLKKGEQLWYQIVIVPTDIAWTKNADKVVAQILGEGSAKTPDFVDKMMDWIVKGSEMIYSIWGDIEVKEEKKADPLKMMNLKPNQKKQVEGIYHKASKFGYLSKVRMVYLARKEVFVKTKVASGFVGFMKQFASLDTNNLKPDTDITATSTSYYFKKSRLWDRQTRIIRRYKGRTAWGGRLWQILNTEELATLWHFPVESVVKAPLIQKAPGRKSEPPMGLPVSQETVSQDLKTPVYNEETTALFSTNNGNASKDKNGNSMQAPASTKPTTEKGAPPSNLPFA